MKIKKITQCRVCGSKSLELVVDLGIQELTGVFPKSRTERLTEGPLSLLFCEACGLLQLAHSYDMDEMYGMNYGYRSGLNRSMVNHLSSKAEMLSKRFDIESGDTVLDIGSNDGTLLNSYSTSGLRKVGMDPTGVKFKKHYNDDVELVADFFSAKKYHNEFSNNAKIVTSISMFYDLESPVAFAEDVNKVLRDDGVWHFEQSYMPSMLRNNSYDTICHEHLEYYSLSTVKFIVESVGMKIIDVSLNDINGGSFAVTAAKKCSSYKANDVLISWFIKQENKQSLSTAEPYKAFAERVIESKERLLELLHDLKSAGKSIYGYGASTKGNVILQYCGITTDLITAILEVNDDKFGSFTPKTMIPIISEKEVEEIKPDYLMVLPWHFRNSILTKETVYLSRGGKLIFPLPQIEIV